MSEDFAARRAAARARLDALDPHMKPGGTAADPRRKDWFEAVYVLADGDFAAVPWAGLAPHPLLADWLAHNGRLDGLKAADVGCGLGDNAAALAEAGAGVVAFDLVSGAIDWARRRFPGGDIDFRVADLFELPADWRGAFDFVQETYTLQALPAELLPSAGAALGGLLAPGGRLLVIARAREEDQQLAGPPWPLTRAAIEGLAGAGLRMTTLEDIAAAENRPRHWRALLTRD